MMKTHTLFGAELISDKDRIVSSLRSKPFEPDSLALWQSICGEGDVVLDVGAYTGLYSIIAAKKGCIVHAFEPLKANQERIIQNAQINGVKFTVHPVLVSNHVGMGSITVNPNVQGLTSGASMVRKNGTKVRVPSITIDSLQLRNVAALKIDTERSEPQVLAGALRTLDRCRPRILVEVLDQERATSILRVLRGRYERDRVIDERNWWMLPC